MMADSVLSGTTALVTGAGSGVGRATAIELTRRGATVVLIGRKVAALRETADLCRDPDCVIAAPCDICRPNDISTAFERIDQLDSLVLAAGIEKRGNIENMTTKSWNDTLETNLTGAFLCSRSAIPKLRKSERGSIIAIASGAAKQGYAGLGAYCASKFGLLGLMQSLADELVDDGIRVSTVLPGSILTTFGGTSIEEKLERAAEGKKYIQPEDVARSIVHLLETPDGAWTQEMNLWPF